MFTESQEGRKRERRRKKGKRKEGRKGKRMEVVQSRHAGVRSCESEFALPLPGSMTLDKSPDLSQCCSVEHQKQIMFCLSESPPSPLKKGGDVNIFFKGI